MVFLSRYLEIIAIESSTTLQSSIKANDRNAQLYNISVFLLASILFGFLFEFISYIFTSPIQRAFRDSSRETFKSFISLRYPTFSRIGSGEVHSTIERRSKAVSDIMDVIILNVFPVAVTIVMGSVAISRKVGIIIPVIMVMSVVLYLYVTILITKKRNRLRKEVNIRINEQSNTMYDILVNYETVLAYGNANMEVARYDEKLAQTEKLYSELYRALYMLNFVQRMIFTMQMFIVIFVGIYGILMDPFTDKVYLLYINMTRSIAGSMYKSGYLYSKYAMGMVNYRNTGCCGLVFGSNGLVEEDGSNDIIEDRNNNSGNKNIHKNEGVLNVYPKKSENNDRDTKQENIIRNRKEENDDHPTNNSIPRCDDMSEEDYLGECIGNRHGKDIVDIYIPKRKNHQINENILEPTIKQEINTTKEKESHTPDKLDNKSNSELSCINTITFINVSVFHGTNEILKNVNFQINKGDKIAFLGTNGAGKSSLIKTLLGFTEYTGHISIEGRDMRSIPIENIRNRISYIHQDSAIFNESIKHNIMYGKRDATNEEIIEVCQKMDVHESIKRLSDGYLTIAGERGSFLSGGERQKIAFARAALKNGDILVLDEPTASLDKMAESAILERMLGHFRSKTLLMIVHNVGLLYLFVKNAFLAGGTVKEFGTHDELFALGGEYYKFYSNTIL